MPGLRVLTRKSEVTLHPATNGSTPDPVGYYGSNPWCDVAKKITDKYKCPEHLVTALPVSPEEARQLLDECKPPWKASGCCSVLCTPMCQDPGFGPRGLAAFPKGSLHCPMEADPNPGEVSWDTPERKEAAYEGGSQ